MVSNLGLSPILSEVVCSAQNRPVLQVVEKRNQWQLVKISGTFEGRTLKDEELYYIAGLSGIAEAPIPLFLREALEADAKESQGFDLVYVVHKPTAEKLARERPLPAAAASDCFGWSSFTKSADVNVSTPETLLSIALANAPGDNGYFSGSLKVKFPVKAKLTGEITLGVFKVGCVPTAIKFKKARVSGQIDVTSSLDLKVQFHIYKDFVKNLVKVPVYSYGFFIGPIPVYVEFNAFIDAILHLESPNLVDVEYAGVGSGSGKIDYSCSLNGCTGSSTFSHSFHQTGDINVLASGVRGIARPYLFGGLQVILYDESFATARIGVAPYFQADVWGFAGAGCGDANGDGHHEYVQALTADLDTGIEIRAKVAAPVLGSWAKLEKVIESWENHVQFFDIIGSNGLQPLVIGTSTAYAGYAKTFKFKMRPCYPYTDDLVYDVNWGDGTQHSYFWGSPQDEASASHTWTSLGKTYTVSAVLIYDAHGRYFYKVDTSRPVHVVRRIPVPVGFPE